MPTSHLLAEHYQRSLRADEVLARIYSHYPDGPKLHQLAPLDQLHIGGISASARLLNLLDVAEHSLVLDIGSGLGGLMRQGSALGFHMVGLDITHRFNILNKALSEIAVHQNGAAQRWVTGNAGALPFAANSFDAVLFQHSLMNMPDPAQVIAECHRVLRPGGKLVMHEVISGGQSANLRFPVPWADTPEHSHLLDIAMLLQLLKEGGLQLLHCEDWTSTALEWRQRQGQKEQATAKAVLSPQWVFGERFVEMSNNLLENLSNDAINVVEISACC
ncbi:class I SAM-dependent methyltransferase [Vreelandella olivaria]|uniref:class I SAM-dependent methyltransferase n=1 Tax=Vreelandella olivaria TaxID=390919 RepID=UPI00201EA526|nr:class I SAM-dependent methyltransferase [Halomonas olivaria]